jgi:hypothetical protein
MFWFGAFENPGGQKKTQEEMLEHSKQLFNDWHEPIPTIINNTEPEDMLLTDIHEIPPMDKWSNGRVSFKCEN